MTTTLYGIPNCDTVRKSRQWMDDNDHEYDFHDFKKDGVDDTLIRQWILAHGVDTMVNKRGTTYRNLTDEEKADAGDRNKAVALLVQHPSMIKRPVLEHHGASTVGFKEDTWSAMLS